MPCRVGRASSAWSASPVTMTPRERILEAPPAMSPGVSVWKSPCRKGLRAWGQIAAQASLIGARDSPKSYTALSVTGRLRTGLWGEVDAIADLVERDTVPVFHSFHPIGTPAGPIESAGTSVRREHPQGRRPEALQSQTVHGMGAQRVAHARPRSRRVPRKSHRVQPCPHAGREIPRGTSGGESEGPPTSEGKPELTTESRLHEESLPVAARFSKDRPARRVSGNSPR